MNFPIKIDIVSDVACPWCYVGKKRLEQALKQLEGNTITTEWHPFQLDPSMPAEGKTRDQYLIAKFGDSDRVEQMTQTLVGAGSGLDIAFDFGEKWLAVNTLPLHQLLEIAGQEGFKDELKERFFKAYFVDLDPLNDMEVLFSIMADYGWAPEKVTQVINDPAIGKRVQDKIEHFKKLGVTGVPFFVINNKYGISGAQPPKVFLETLEKISQEQEDLSIQGGDSCDIDDPNC